MRIEFESFEEIKNFLEDLGYEVKPKEEKRAMTGAERTAKWRENVTKRHNNVTETSPNVTNVTNVTEEREEEKESFSPSFPSSLPSSPSDSPINYPITPIIPSSQEKEGEREETYAVGAGKRGELRSFGEFVKLSEAEYKRLCDDFGTAKANSMIRSMNSYIGADETGRLAKKYQTRNHNLTLRNWENRHQKELQAKTPQTVPKQPKQESWLEIAERLSRQDPFFPTDRVIEVKT